MNFRDSLDYLFSLGNEVETMKLGLHNIGSLLAALGNPQDNYKKVQVAGTNGKGSVCAFLNSICVGAGIRAGLYTSPHLVSIRERIKIDGVDINEDEFARHASHVRETAERLVAEGMLENLPTFFEQVTAIALLAFAEAKVELAILETGLGGRYDATTAAHAEIAAITRIDLDHQEYLGDTIEKIAAEKAAIIRPDSKVVIGSQYKEAERVIRGRCREVGVEPIWATSDIVTKTNNDPFYPIYTHTFTTERNIYPNIDSGLLGRHQAENAAIAIGIAEVLRDEGFDIPDIDLSIGLGTATHPGRLERLGHYLLDGAHNPAGARALAAYLDEFVREPTTLVFGAMKDKAAGEMLRILAPKAVSIILTKADNSRSMEPSELLRRIPDEFDAENAVVTNSVFEALSIAGTNVPRGLILITGSLYLVGEAKRILSSGENLEFQI